MALELITGRAGKAHIGSEDDRAYHANVNGDGRYVLRGGTAEISNANSVHIDPTEFLVDGAHVRITGVGEDVAIDNGVSSYKRIDVIALHYTRVGGDDDYVESIALTAIKGANVELEASPVAPEMPTSTTILEGSADVYVPIFQLLIDGLTPKDLTALLKPYALPITNGGTGQNTAAEIRNVLGLGNTTAALPIANGGTGYATRKNAMDNLWGDGAVENDFDNYTSVGTYVVNYLGKITNHPQDDVYGEAYNWGVLCVFKNNTNTIAQVYLSDSIPEIWYRTYGWGERWSKWKCMTPLRAYPVGAVYISYNSRSPAQLFGGTWTPITGRFPYFNNSTGTGGSNTHTHGLNGGYAQIIDSNYGDGNLAIVAGRKSATWSNSTGTLMQWRGGQFNRFQQGNISTQSYATALGGSTDSGNNMPPYQAFYAWRRTA